mmetsp:Transcript_21206/g.56578  ORF Transcript_21206/g.56578 Transcript_21206/m.56578 type:complete len:332 (+) Transcript_21206:483-1478(+)
MLQSCPTGHQGRTFPSLLGKAVSYVLEAPRLEMRPRRRWAAREYPQPSVQDVSDVCGEHLGQELPLATGASQSRKWCLLPHDCVQLYSKTELPTLHQHLPHYKPQHDRTGHHRFACTLALYPRDSHCLSVAGCVLRPTQLCPRQAWMESSLGVGVSCVNVREGELEVPVQHLVAARAHVSRPPETETALLPACYRHNAQTLARPPQQWAATLSCHHQDPQNRGCHGIQKDPHYGKLHGFCVPRLSLHPSSAASSPQCAPDAVHLEEQWEPLLLLRRRESVELAQLCNGRSARTEAGLGPGRRQEGKLRRRQVRAIADPLQHMVQIVDPQPA